MFGFAQADIEVTEVLYEKISEMSPLFVVKEIIDEQIPERKDGKMIENVARHANTIFTRDENKVDALLRCHYLEDLEEIGDAYELREGKRNVKVNRTYQCRIAVYQLAKLRMLEFYCDFPDKYVDRRYYKYCYMDVKDVH